MSSEKREDCSCNGTQQCVGSDGGSGEHEISVDKVVEGLQEDCQESETGQKTRKGRCDPVDLLLVTSPCEHEKSSREDGSSDNHRWKTPFWDGNAVVLLELADVGWLDHDDVGTGEELAGDHSEVWETTDTWVHAVDALEDDWVGGQEEVEKPVDEGHIYGEEEDNRLSEEEAERARKVLGDQFAEVDFDFLLLGVDTPVASATAEFPGLLDEDDWWVGLLEEKNVEAESKESHDGDNVLGPSPSQVGFRDETANEWRQEWSGEYSHGEDCNGGTTSAVVEHIREHGRDDGQRASSCETREETTDHDGLDVCRRSDSNLEDGEHQHGDNQGQFTAFQLGKRCP